ncbi:MAG TPA: efflux RND transporter periplasmic adaptor subunit [Thermoanaerobaculia bacterium]
MKSKRTLTIVVLFALAAAGFFAWQRSASAEAPKYRYAEVERRDLKRTVSATGTLNAVTTVSVGTQVSGQVAELFVDFNDRVEKGQLLARIDPKLALQAVTDAEATVERNRASLVASQREHARNRELMTAGLVARSSFDTTESQLLIAQANVKSAQVSLDRARQNLSYTEVLSPIDGVIVERNVDLGQTVAASLSAPQLFLIAEDLSRMQILVKVDESDISLIQQGQSVTFTVPSLPRENFRGTVKQVRLQSAVTENVVNYTVVIEVDNREKKLLPGMTASVDFLVASADDALAVPNAALRFAPQREALASGANRTGASRTSTSGAGNATAGAGAASGARRNRTRSADAGRLFIESAGGKLQPVRVKVGISDGTYTQVTGDGVTQGLRIVAGTNEPGATQPAAGSSPFGAQQQRQQGPRPGGF